MCLVKTPTIVDKKQQIVANIKDRFRDVEKEHKDELNKIKQMQKDL